MNTRVKELESKIVKASQDYYEGRESGYTDSEFDAMIDELRKLNPESEILTSVGWGYKPLFTVVDSLERVNHPLRIVRGLGKVKVTDDFAYKVGYYTPKYDGCSVTLYYEDGVLESALTRGDGITGIDVTNKLKEVVPNLVDSRIKVVTGEWIISKKNKDKYYPNEVAHRNLAVGILMRNEVDSNIVNRFDFVAYRINLVDNYLVLDSRESVMKVLKGNGFNTAPIIKNEKDTKGLFTSKMIKDYDRYNLDGVVYDSGISVGFHDGDSNIIEYNDEIAYKYESDSKEVTVTGIEWNRTRTGKLVPVVYFNPVVLSGARIQKATAFNAEYIKASRLGVGSKIKVCRSNEVIPYIEEVITESDPFIPVICSYCGSKLVKNGVDIMCDNPNCEANKYNNLYRWIDCVASIKGASYSLINSMIEYAGWEKVEDIYTCEVDWSNLKNMNGIGQSKIDMIIKINNNLHSVISMDLAIYGCNIPKIGWKQSQKFNDSMLLSNLTHQYRYLVESDLNRIGITPAVMDSFMDNFDRISSIFNSAKEYIKVIEDEKLEDSFDNKIKVCITGKLESGLTKSGFYDKYSDKVIESDVSNCDVLICNKEGSSKYNKAVKLGKIIKSEGEFLVDYIQN